MTHVLDYTFPGLFLWCEGNQIPLGKGDLPWLAPALQGAILQGFQHEACLPWLDQEDHRGA